MKLFTKVVPLVLSGCLLTVTAGCGSGGNQATSAEDLNAFKGDLSKAPPGVRASIEEMRKKGAPAQAAAQQGAPANQPR